MAEGWLAPRLATAGVDFTGAAAGLAEALRPSSTAPRWSHQLLEQAAALVASAAPSSKLAQPQLLEALGDLLLFEECPAVVAQSARALASIAATSQQAADAVATAPNALTALGELLLGAAEPGVQAAATEALASIAQHASTAVAADKVAGLPHLLDALVDVLLVGHHTGAKELASAQAAAVLVGSIAQRSEAQAERAASTLGLLQGLVDLLGQLGGPAALAAARALGGVARHSQALADQVASKEGALEGLVVLLGADSSAEEQACAVETLAWIARAGSQGVRAKVAAAAGSAQERLSKLLGGGSCGAAGVLAASQSKAAAEKLSAGAALEGLVAQMRGGKGADMMWAALALGAVAEHGGQLAERVASAKGCLEALAALAAAEPKDREAEEAQSAALLALAPIARQSKVRGLVGGGAGSGARLRLVAARTWPAHCLVRLLLAAGAPATRSAGTCQQDLPSLEPLPPLPAGPVRARHLEPRLPAGPGGGAQGDPHPGAAIGDAPALGPLWPSSPA
jgi:hypothetical protein